MKSELRACDIEIMERLQITANSHANHITFTHMLFFLRLVDYALSEQSFAQNGDLLVALSENEMVSAFNISKRMITQSLRILSDCDIILRYKGNKKSFVTVAKKEFFERNNTYDTVKHI